MSLVIRRIKMDDSPNRGDVRWLLFEHGQIETPIRVLSDFDVDALLDSIEEQRAAHYVEQPFRPGTHNQSADGTPLDTFGRRMK